jgi:hypothetical protein
MYKKLQDYYKKSMGLQKVALRWFIGLLCALPFWVRGGNPQSAPSARRFPPSRTWKHESG